MKATNFTVDQIADRIAARLAATKRPSAWNRGVYAYAFDILESLDSGTTFRDYGRDLWALDSEEIALNGASDWSEYSWSGCALIYDSDIARRLCTPSELRRTHNGERRPNKSEEWLDTQARALHQAWALIRHTIKSASYC